MKWNQTYFNVIVREFASVLWGSIKVQIVESKKNLRSLRHFDPPEAFGILCETQRISRRCDFTFSTAQRSSAAYRQNVQPIGQWVNSNSVTGSDGLGLKIKPIRRDVFGFQVTCCSRVPRYAESSSAAAVVALESQVEFVSVGRNQPRRCSAAKPAH